MWHYLVKQLRCSGDQCPSIFKTFCGYRKHLLKCPLIQRNVSNCDDTVYNTYHSAVDIETEASRHPEQEQSNIVDDSDEYSFDGISDDFNPESSSENQLLCLISKLLCLGVPISTVSIITDNIEEIVNSIFDETGKIIPKCMNEEWNFFSTKVLASFKETSSVYKLKKYFCKDIVKPKEIAIGVRNDQVFDKSKNAYVQRNVTNTFMYIPILDTLREFLKNKSVQPFFSNMKSSDIKDSTISTFSDGSNYKNSELFQMYPNAIQLQLYFDEFECSAPLGTKTGSHKMGGLYFIVRNIPTKFLGQLENIFLAGLFYSADIKDISLNAVLRPIIEDIKILEHDGVDVDFLPYKLRGTLVALSHDNLGGNAMYRMVESFSANYFCRICLTHKSDIQNVFSETNKLCRLRTKEFYNTIPTNIQPGTDNVYMFCIKNTFENDLCFGKAHS